MSGETCSKTQSKCNVLFQAFLPQDLGLFQSGFPVPYILASDGVVFSFSFDRTKTCGWETNFTRQAIMTLAFHCWRLALLCLPMRGQKLYFLPNENMRRFFNDLFFSVVAPSEIQICQASIIS